MIPLKDDNPTAITPVVTIGLIAVNIIVFLYQWSLGPNGEQDFVFAFGATPAALFGGQAVSSIPPSLTLISSMFIHGGIMHIAGNMLYLWIFGDNIEDVMGHGRFIVFYLLCGVAAAYAHAVTAPSSGVPMIGASGAISGVLGSYLVLFPRARVLTLVPLGFFTQFVHVPASVMLGLWIVIQFVNGTFGLSGTGGGIAWFAHVGGFVTGMIFIRFFVRRPSFPQNSRRDEA